jgi:hypothetical protein
MANQLLKNGVLYTFGETTIEVEFRGIEIPFERVDSVSDYAWQFEGAPDVSMSPGCAEG